MQLAVYFAEECKAVVDLKDNDGFNPLDIAIYRLNYEMAQYFYSRHGLRPIENGKQIYEAAAKTPFDYELFLQMLENGDKSKPTRELFFERLKREHQEWLEKDLVVDTRETWK